jgi:hypothetical protein
MNMMPSAQSMAPQMPSPDQIERAKAILEAVTWEDIEPVLRTDERRNYNIDIETDSTVFEDGETEKAQRIECVTAVVSMLEKGVPAIQMNPKLAPLMKELGMFTLGAFKIGRTLEETFEETFDQLGNIEPQPNPEQQKMEMEAKAKQEEFALKAKEREQEIGFKQTEFQIKQQELEATLALKREELGIKQQELQMKAEENAFSKQVQMEQHQQDRQFRQEEMAFKREDAHANRQAQAEERHFKHRDMEERRSADIRDKEERRELEATFMSEKVGKSTSDLNKKVVDAEAQRQLKDREGLRQEVTGIAEQLLTSNERIAQQQVMIAEALQGLFAKQEETQNALLTAIKRIAAPRNIKRDPKTGRAIGVEILEEAMA